MIDHNVEIQNLFQKWNIKPRCLVCHEELIMGSLANTPDQETRLWCPKCRLYKDTLLYLRKCVE